MSSFSGNRVKDSLYYFSSEGLLSPSASVAKLNYQGAQMHSPMPKDFKRITSAGGRRDNTISLSSSNTFNRKLLIPEFEAEAPSKF
jgi:hypothetical protein